MIVRLFAWGLLLFSLACSSKRDDRFQTREGNFFDALAPEPTYAEIFNRKTVEKRTHSEFEPVLAAFITLWDTELREAYVKEMKAQFRLLEADEKVLAQEQLQEDEAYFVFIVSVATREPSWNDLHQKKSMWRVTLENSEASLQVNPERVELISPKDETAKHFYRRADNFKSTYKIRFPRSPLRNERDLFLHITGTRGALFAKFQNARAPDE